MFRAKDQLFELATRCVSIFNATPMNILTDENVKRSPDSSFSFRRVLFFHDSDVSGDADVTKPSKLSWRRAVPPFYFKFSLSMDSNVDSRDNRPRSSAFTPARPQLLTNKLDLSSFRSSRELRIAFKMQILTTLRAHWTFSPAIEKQVQLLFAYCRAFEHFHGNSWRNRMLKVYMYTVKENTWNWCFTRV